MDFKEFTTKFEKVPVEEFDNTHSQISLVSVCVQTFNQVNYINKCLEAILSQKTTFPFEILLADDESTDGTREICIEFYKKYPEKIRLFLHSRKNNIEILGQASANFITLYNFYNSKGNYVAICEGDDYWTDPLKLQKQFDFMNSNPEYSICYHDFKIINSQNTEIISEKASALKVDLTADELIYPWQHSATLTIFFKNIFRNIPFETTEVINLDIFLYTLLGQIGPGKFLKQIKPAHYRIHQKGLWSERKKEAKLLSKINTYQQISLYYKKLDKNEATIVFNKRIIKLKKGLILLYFKKRCPIKMIHMTSLWLRYKFKYI